MIANSPRFRRLAAGVLGCGAMLLAGAAAAADQTDWSRHNSGSIASIDHSLWGQLLEVALLDYEDVRERMTISRSECFHTRSRIPRCKPRSTSTAVMHGVKLLPYDYMNERFRFYLSSYLRQMGKVKISTYRRNEQLAYWLNVHNAGVVQTILQEYPVDDLSDLRNAPGEAIDEDQPWARTVVTVEGVPLSLHDIEQDVLFANWKHPLIVYGLFDGTIGSPALLPEPFEAATVWEQLWRRGRQFVNSARFMQLYGDEAELSLAYAYARPLFESPKAVLAHAMTLARPGLRAQLEQIAEVELDFYEDRIADYKPESNYHEREMLKRFVDYNGYPTVF